MCPTRIDCPLSLTGGSRASGRVTIYRFGGIRVARTLVATSDGALAWANVRKRPPSVGLRSGRRHAHNDVCIGEYRESLGRVLACELSDVCPVGVHKKDLLPVDEGNLPAVGRPSRMPALVQRDELFRRDVEHADPIEGDLLAIR